ncbi:MAG: phage major capsid protein, partial [Sphingobium limneticum]
YTRLVIAKTLARLDGVSAVGIAQQRWGKSDPNLVQVVRAAVAGGGTEAGEWGAELVHIDRYTGDFIDFLYGQTVFDQLPLREVPANINIAGSDGAATAYWVGQSKSIPVTKADFFDVNLTALKVAALAVVSKELLRDSSPSAEMLVRDALVSASAQRVDQTFFSASAAVANVAPAGILNGVTAIDSAGPDVEGVIADVKALYASFIAAKNAAGLQFATTQSLAKALGLMQNVMGNFAFPGLSANGGALLGDKLTAGDNIGAGDLILLKPSDIYKIGDRGVEVSLSTEAAIQMDSAPDGASDTPTPNANVVSMFQTESVAIKVVRPLNFAKRRASAVAYIGDADYGTPVVTP